MYGQLGTGLQWDDRAFRVIPNLKGVISAAAGLRHSAAVTGGPGNVAALWTWGDNSYGQLGLGDTHVRLIPVQVTGASSVTPVSVTAGDRHTVVVTSHKPMVIKDHCDYREYFKIIEVGDDDMQCCMCISRSILIYMLAMYLFITSICKKSIFFPVACRKEGETC